MPEPSRAVPTVPEVSSSASRFVVAGMLMVLLAMPRPPSSQPGTPTATTEIYTGEDTLSLHDALPISATRLTVAPLMADTAKMSDEQASKLTALFDVFDPDGHAYSVGDVALASAAGLA